MALTIEDLNTIKKEIFAIADDKYVHIEDCNDKQQRVNAKFANDDKRIDKLIDKMNLWNKLLWAIASSSIGALLASIFELILK